MHIVDYKGNALEVSCLGCARENGEMARVGTVLTTKHFDAHQDVEIPIPGFMIISSRRHLKSIDEFADAEKNDFIDTLISVRTAMRHVLGIEVIDVVQEEDTKHHFHVWLFPRYQWMLGKFGEKTSSLRPIMEYAREHLRTKENLAKVDETVKKLKKYFDQQV